MSTLQAVTVPVPVELVQLLIAQSQKHLELSLLRDRLNNSKFSMEMSLHSRDEHGRFWDAESSLNHRREMEKELNRGLEEFWTNQRRMDELLEELKG